MENKNYECKRCFYNCNQLNDMKKHLNKKIKCYKYKTICSRNIRKYIRPK